MVNFGQIIIGPPGSGKSTYCAGVSQVLNSLGRKTVIVNLDPQVTLDELPYKPDVDIRELVDAINVSERFNLGPNAALLYCMEYLLENVDWLEQEIAKLGDCYLLYDIPGQVELFTHHTALRTVVEKLQNNGQRLTGVALMDSTLCADPFKYVSALLTSLSCQVFLQLPHVNVLSKMDLIRHFKQDLVFRLDFYTEANSLQELLLPIRNYSAVVRPERFEKFVAALCELIEDFNIVSFGTLDIQDRESVLRLVRTIDRCTGFISNENYDDTYMECNAQYLQERYIDSD